MPISKKQLLGMGGLAAVVGLTAYAFTIPTPDASAASVSGQVNISVEVHNDAVAEIDVTSPVSGTITMNDTMAVSIFYSGANSINYTLTNTTTGGTSSGTYVPTTAPESSSRSVVFDLNASGLGFGRYRFEANINDGADYAYTSFNYIPLGITFTGNHADNGDPIVQIEHAKGVQTVEIQAYDKDGKAVFPNPISVTIDDPSTHSKQLFTLPLTSYGAATGDYDIIAIPKDSDGNALPMVTGQPNTDVDYVAPDSPVVPDTDGDEDVPDVPKTGGFLADLNISSADYLVSGLIVFGIATALAFVILRKQKKSLRK